MTRQYRFTPRERLELFKAVQDRIAKLQREDDDGRDFYSLYVLRAMLEQFSDPLAPREASPQQPPRDEPHQRGEDQEQDDRAD